MIEAQKSPSLTEQPDAKKDAVLLQMGRLLASPLFRNSRRYTDLLRFVVHETLEGHADVLKERTLGIEVFGREPGFDTAGDSIVRVAAAEVRKRIAQYYQEDGHENELRIELPSGSYVPHFRSPTQEIAPAMPAIVPDPVLPAIQESRHIADPIATPPRIKFFIGFFAGVAISIAAFLGYRLIPTQAGQQDLLAPLFQAQREVTICIGTPNLTQNQPGANDEAAASLGHPRANNTLIPVADAMALSRFQSRLALQHKANRVQLSRDTTFENLRSGPAILIGAFDNEWTLRLTGQMRFRFSGTDEILGQIVDSKGGKGQHWDVDFHVPYSDRTQDYAIVAIVHDPTLDQPLVISAGIGPNGTAAASEFLSNSQNLIALRNAAPATWGGKNVEVVLATQVIQDNSGPPRVLATEYW